MLLRRCTEGERWAGLWDFPRIGLKRAYDPVMTPTEVEQKIAEQIGGRVEIGKLLTTIKHGVTRYRITLICYQATCRSRRLGRGTTEHLRWAAPDELTDLPLSTTGRKLAALVHNA